MVRRARPLNVTNETIDRYRLLKDLLTSDGPVRKHLPKILPEIFPHLFE
jgi:hypothetical protein